jgi:hypothetical protein
VTGIRGVLISAVSPEQRADLLSAVAGSPPTALTGGGVSVPAGNATLLILTPAALESEFEVASPSSSTHATGLVFGVHDLARTQASLRAAEARTDRHDSRLLVPPAPGQGATFIFEEIA